jgi:heme/copper-type cytochrome/quinol oxidase subunit 3
MQALPPAPVPPPRRQVLVGTAVASVGAIMVMGGMLGVFIRMRERTLDATGEATWVPQGIEIPGVPTNVMLISFFVLVLFAQWTVYAARRRDRLHVGLSLGLVGIVGLAIVNAQVYVYNRMEMPAAETAYAGMFYAVTATMMALVIIGLVFTGVTAFRLLGGRESDQEIVAAHALYWYVLAAVFSAMWLIVFVTK